MIIEVPKGYTFSAKKDIIAFEENSMLKLKKRPFFPEFNLENGRVVATETSDLYPCRIFD